MHSAFHSRTIRAAALCSLLVLALTANLALAAPMSHTSKPFAGPKANKGTVTHTTEGKKSILTLSDDFVVPDTPDPHWMLVDSKGTTYLVQKLKVKNDGYNKRIEVPSYVKDVAKVIIWCAWAETNLGEASFDKPVK